MRGSRDSNVLLAFDFGLRRIGIATGNLHTRTASPLTTLATAGEALWRELDRVIAEWRPGRLVVGLPSDDGGSIAGHVRTFVAALQERYGLPVVMVDEDFTSHAARAALREGRRSGYLRRRVARDRVDRQAACLIAEQWMNEQTDGSRAS
jgi:putative holliday junction resolvase